MAAPGARGPKHRRANVTCACIHPNIGFRGAIVHSTHTPLEGDVESLISALLEAPPVAACLPSNVRVLRLAERDSQQIMFAPFYSLLRFQAISAIMGANKEVLEDYRGCRHRLPL